MSDSPDPLGHRREILELIARNKWQAHQILFAHRHQLGGKPIPPADYHPDLVEDFWSADPCSIRMVFRGGAKSTLAEEDVTIAAMLRAYRNILIIGSSETRAAERLASVSYELAHNEWIVQLFGELKGAVWTQTKLVTSGNVCVQAMGRDQDIRGIKYLDWRPDFILVDDFEDKDNVQTPEGRAKTLRWFLAELLPACAPHCKVRIRATPMNAESVPMQLSRSSAGLPGWPCKTFPVEYRDEGGRRRSSWPSAYSLDWIDDRRSIYQRVGELGVWEREYMCKAVSDADQVFKKEMLRVAPRERSWQATYAMIDPARTTNNRSATTGWAVWSWINNRLVVWAAGADLLLPDEIVALAFDLHERFDPVWLGVELDGLEQFLLQPMRHEMVRRGTYLPVRGMRAPRGKLDFIRGLQPFFHAREVEFAQPLPALEEQLLNFPTGRIDAPNALAYALQMRPGLPLYESFGAGHIVLAPEWDKTRPLFLACNATGSMVTAALLQAQDGRLQVLADWVREGTPGELAPYIYADAVQVADTGRMASAERRPRAWDEMLKVAPREVATFRRNPPVFVVPPHHQEKYTNVGLTQAIRALPAECRVGGAESSGALHLRDLLGRQSRGLPVVEVGAGARWTLRALAGGYTCALVRGHLADYAEEGPYRLLMEGIESFCGMIRAGLAKTDDEDEDNQQNWAYSRDGRRYKSAMPARVR